MPDVQIEAYLTKDHRVDVELSVLPSGTTWFDITVDDTDLITMFINNMTKKNVKHFGESLRAAANELRDWNTRR